MGTRPESRFLRDSRRRPHSSLIVCRVQRGVPTVDHASRMARRNLKKGLLDRGRKGTDPMATTRPDPVWLPLVRALKRLEQHDPRVFAHAVRGIGFYIQGALHDSRRITFEKTRDAR